MQTSSNTPPNTRPPHTLSLRRVLFLVPLVMWLVSTTRAGRGLRQQSLWLTTDSMVKIIVGNNNHTMDLSRLEQEVGDQRAQIEHLTKSLQQQETSYQKELQKWMELVADLKNQTSSSSVAPPTATDASIAPPATTAAIPEETTSSSSRTVEDDIVSKNRDAWYDTTNNNNKTHLNVTIELRDQRRDRLGTNVQRPFRLLAYSMCQGYKFCTLKRHQGTNKIFGFPTCRKNLTHPSPYRGDIFDVPVNESGTYGFARNDGALQKALRELDPECVYSDELRHVWRDMILNAAKDSSLNTTLSQQDLFVRSAKNKTTTVAVNIRRGDFADWGRPLIWDEIYVRLLEELRPAIERTGQTPEVHLFSEDYGMIDPHNNITRNWDLYNGLVDYFHLAPDLRTSKNAHNMDMSLNLRDWQHFVRADILVVGGTFSRMPAYGRPRQPDPTTGKGLTIHPCFQNDCWKEQKGTPLYSYAWNGARMDRMELLNMPASLAAPVVA